MSTAEKIERRPRTPIHQVKAEFFRTLGHPARVRVIGCCGTGRRPWANCRPSLGSIPAAPRSTSPRCAGRILEARKEGTSVYYSVRDPRIFQMMESARQVIGSHLEEATRCWGSWESRARGPGKADDEVPFALGRTG